MGRNCGLSDLSFIFTNSPFEQNRCKFINKPPELFLIFKFKFVPIQLTNSKKKIACTHKPLKTRAISLVMALALSLALMQLLQQNITHTPRWPQGGCCLLRQPCLVLGPHFAQPPPNPLRVLGPELPFIMHVCAACFSCLCLAARHWEYLKCTQPIDKCQK